MARIRELQALLGLNLEEIALVLRNEDRLAEIRLTYRDERTSDAERRALLRECLGLQQDLRGTVAGQAGRAGRVPGRPGRPDQQGPGPARGGRCPAGLTGLPAARPACGPGPVRPAPGLFRLRTRGPRSRGRNA